MLFIFRHFLTRPMPGILAGLSTGLLFVDSQYQIDHMKAL